MSPNAARETVRRRRKLILLLLAVAFLALAAVVYRRTGLFRPFSQADLSPPGYEPTRQESRLAAPDEPVTAPEAGVENDTVVLEDGTVYGPIVISGGESGDDLPVPGMADWVDYGPVLATGAEGEWDFAWAGMTPASVIEKDGVYYFYYVAADGYRSFDGGPRHRAIGVATSPDGIHFTKYAGNPVMTHRPYDGEEEGANSAGITLDENGRFVMVYGAAAGPYDTIVADGRFAYSDDGFVFNDAGQALDHDDRNLYGFGDEIFPVAVTRQAGRWVVYYQPNGIRETEHTLGAAWGTTLDGLTNSAVVLNGESGGLPVDTWGNVVVLDEQTLIFFNQRLWWPDTFVEVRAASPETPYQLSEPLTRYDIPNLKRGVVFLDKERRTWFMYYNEFGRFWYLKLAPFGAADTTPPSAPADLNAVATAHDQIVLNWEPAIDGDTGVVEYRIYRDGSYRDSTKALTWGDSELTELTAYAYEVTAVNFHGVESPPASINVTTPADNTPPAIASVVATGELTQLHVTFNEPVDPATATDPGHYIVDSGVSVIDAAPGEDGRTIVLTTSAHTPGAVYSLVVTGILDQAQLPNIMLPTARVYTAGPISDLAGRWLAAGGDGNQTPDVSGYGRDGSVYGAMPVNDRPGALAFDGLSSYVQISGAGHLQSLTGDSFTLAAWVRPDALPASNNGAHIVSRSGEHPAYFYGVFLMPSGRIRARLFHSDESTSEVTSPPVQPDQWIHVAMVVDVATGQLHLYLNGQPVPGSPRPLNGDLVDLWPQMPRDDRSGAYFLGSGTPDRGAGSFYDAYFHGALADVRFYRRALSAAEILVVGQE